MNSQSVRKHRTPLRASKTNSTVMSRSHAFIPDGGIIPSATETEQAAENTPVETRDHWTVTDWAAMNNTDTSRVRDILSTELSTAVGGSEYTLIALQPTQHSPTGELAIVHPDYDQHTCVAISSTGSTTNPTYHVNNPTPTDIFTYSHDGGLEAAIRTAGEVAINERKRCRKQQPAFPTLTSIANRFRNLTTSL